MYFGSSGRKVKKISRSPCSLKKSKKKFGGRAAPFLVGCVILRALANTFNPKSGEKNSIKNSKEKIKRIQKVLEIKFQRSEKLRKK
jgi:hypothetical protein